MKRQKNRLRMLACTALIVAVSAGLAWAAARGVTDKQIKLGLVLVKTGPVAALGIPNGQGMVDYMTYINEKGGIHGRKIKVIVEDCAYSPAKAVTAAMKLLAKDKIFAFVSPWGTAPSTALFPIAQKEKIPLAPACALSTTVYDPFKKYVFAAGTNYVDQSLFIVDYVVNKLKIKKPKIAIFCQDDDWGRDHVKGLKMAQKKYGLPPVAVQSYKYNAVEFKSQVINLMRAKPDVVIV
ncbi:MAG: ABC transporter substrate-binding protein, partial [Proteobacteria bacterium]|nr:ABC transporter substrate-binding protein [Pseudomonadota bacterium]